MKKDIAASVRARLLNLARAQGVDFNTLLTACHYLARNDKQSIERLSRSGCPT